MLETISIEQTKRALHGLANGVHPFTGEYLQDTVLNQAEMIRLFHNLMELVSYLEAEVAKKQASARSKVPFFLTPEQLLEVPVTPTPCTQTTLALRINEAAADNICRKFNAAWISNWLAVQGYLAVGLDRRGKTQKRSTAKAAEIGLTVEWRTSLDGNSYYVFALGEAAQQLVLDNLDEVVGCKLPEPDGLSQMDGLFSTADEAL